MKQLMIKWPDFLARIKRPAFIRKASFLVFVLIWAVMLLSGCTPTATGEGFAIYLTREDIPPAQMEALGSVELADQAIIGIDDIISYNEQTCELKLTQGAFERISQLEVPTSGISFLVCIDKNPVYWGAFWTPFSSQSFNGITIWKPYTISEPYILSLELGYPSSSFYEGNDPRNNPVIVGAFKKAGKLITALTLSEIKALPSSMKGYELYSWPEDDGWHFTLITGTNRSKTIEEITSGETSISESGWVIISCIGEEAIKTALGKVLPGEWVSWCDGSFISGDGALALPPQEIIDNIRSYAAEHGLDLHVPDSR